MALSLTVCEDKQRWDGFVSSSPQANVFCSTAFLDALGEDYDLLFVEEEDQPRLGAVVLKHDGQPVRAPYPLTMYQGILSDQMTHKMPSHSRVKRTLEVTGFLLAEMEQRYDRISFCLHYTLEDLRPFKWFHYHEPERGQFNIELRYTGLLDISTITGFDDHLSTVRTTRRQEYRRAQSQGLEVETSTDLDTFDRLHRLTFERQGIGREATEHQLVLAIAEAALSRGFGELLLCRDKHGAPASATLFLYDSRCGFYLLAANDPYYRKTYSGTYLMLENIRRCKEKGLKAIDFVGINSPNRGDFKTSFNAAPMPYFVVTWERP